MKQYRDEQSYYYIEKENDEYTVKINYSGSIFNIPLLFSTEQEAQILINVLSDEFKQGITAGNRK